MSKLLSFIIILKLALGSQKSNCNLKLQDKIVSFEYNDQPGYQMGLYENNLGRGGIQLLLSLVWAGQSLKP